MSIELDNFFGFVEGFEDQELRRRIFARDPYSPNVPRIQHCKCPHCRKDVFIRFGESGLLELVTEFDPDMDGSDRVFDTDVVPHECEEGDLFEEPPPPF